MTERPNDGWNPQDLGQAGALAGAILAALVGADPFDIRTRSHAVQYLDYFAIALWVASVILFLGSLAASSPLARKSWAYGGIGVAIVAGLLTCSGLIATAFGFSADRDHVLIRVTPSEAAQLSADCGSGELPVRLVGSVLTSSLNDAFITLDFASGSNSVCHTVRIPTRTVTSIVEDPPAR